MATSVLDTGSFWRELLERAGRQAAQTALPIVLVLSGAGSVDFASVAVAVGVAVALTVLKTLAGVRVQPGEALGWQLLDRAVPAAAGVLIGFIPVNLAGLADLDFKAVCMAALFAGVSAVLAFYVTPPAASVPAAAGDEFELL